MAFSLPSHFMIKRSNSHESTGARCTLHMSFKPTECGSQYIECFRREVALGPAILGGAGARGVRIQVIMHRRRHAALALGPMIDSFHFHRSNSTSNSRRLGLCKSAPKHRGCYEPAPTTPSMPIYDGTPS